MTFADTFTPMADHLRAEYGIADKLTTSQLKLGINGLNAHNYLTEKLSVDNTMTAQNSGSYALDKITIDQWTKLLGKTVTVSFDITWSNYQPTENVGNRIGVEYMVIHKDNSIDFVSAWLYPTESSGSMHVSENVKLHSGEVASLDEGNFYNQTNSECTFKATNLKIVENPMGVAPVNLIANWQTFGFGNSSKLENGIVVFNHTGASGTDYFHNFAVPVIVGHKYRISYMARGTGSVRTFFYGWNDKDTGQYIDGHNATELSSNWKKSEQEIVYNPVNPITDKTKISFSFRPGEADTDTRPSIGEATDFSIIDITE